MADGSVNPYDFLSLVAAMTAAQSKPTQAGINRLFSPEVGALTGTLYQDPTASQQGDQYLYAQHAPDIQRALMLPDTDVRKQIVADIVDRGMNLWDVQRNIEAYAAEQARLNPGVYAQEAETGDLKKYAERIQTQFDNLRAAQMRSSADSLKSNPYTQGGLPSPEMRFAPEELLPDFFSKYLTDSVSRQQRLGMLKQGQTAREAAIKFLGDQSGAVDVRTAELPTYETPGYFDSDRRTKEGLKSTSKEVQRLQKNYQDAMKTLATLRTGGRVPGLSEMGKDNAIAAAQRRVDATKEEFDTKMAAAKERGMYGPAQMSAAGGGDIETRRFRQIAERVAKNPDSADERLRIVKEQRIDDLVRQMVAEGISRKAEEAGYTPFMSSMLRRMQFVNAGGD